MEERQQGLTTTRKVVIIRGQAEEGSPLVITEESMLLNDEVSEETIVQQISYCKGCGATIAEPAGTGRCVSCAAILCPACAATRCHVCGQSICPADRTQWGDAFYCRPDFLTKLAGFAVAALLVTVSVLILAFCSMRVDG